MVLGSGTEKWTKTNMRSSRRRGSQERGKDGSSVLPLKQELLWHRDYKVNLEFELGKTTVINRMTSQFGMGGYYCNVCGCEEHSEVNNKKTEEQQEDYDFEARMKELREEEEKAKAHKKEKQKKKRRAEEDLTLEDDDDEMAAVMGFSGFRSTRKNY
ncbi:hypothetical protein A6R68_12615 [Neotoma lepida]|uniref:Uncharacterized protein n=1 Tax=Neotoma lepida TaxID=56216 RepID=A0A1A6H2J0_NEOLE|nr:hypothetical protein A6R68_12615 [Neotoma lepida]